MTSAKFPVGSISRFLGIGALVLGCAACGRSPSDEDVAKLREENAALQARLAEQEAAVAAAPAPEPKPATDDWSWANEPSTSSPRQATQPSFQPELPEPRPLPPPPKPRPQPAKPAPPREEPSTNLLSKPDPRTEPEMPPAPRFVTRTAQAGTSMPLRLQTAMDSGTSRVGEAIDATLMSDVIDRDGNVVLPAGTRLTGRITDVQPAKKAKKKSKLAFTFDTAELPDGRTTSLSAGRALEGEGWRKKDGAIIGGSAAGGDVLGQVLGGDTGSTAAGAVLGGAIATGVLASKRGEDVVVPAGTELELVLDVPASVEHAI